MVSDADDARLVALMLRGSVPAFDLLYLRHASAVRRLGLSILRSPDAADDLVQETFLQVWRHRDGYAPERASVKTWMFTIARHRAIDMARAQARQARMVDAARGVARIAPPAPDALAEAVAREENALLHAALAHLPAAQRRTLMLAYGGGLTQQEVARRTGVPLGTVKSRLRLGQQSIARRLEPGRRVETPSAA